MADCSWKIANWNAVKMKTMFLARVEVELLYIGHDTKENQWLWRDFRLKNARVLPLQLQVQCTDLVSGIWESAIWDPKTKESAECWQHLIKHRMEIDSKTDGFQWRRMMNLRVLHEHLEWWRSLALQEASVLKIRGWKYRVKRQSPWLGRKVRFQLLFPHCLDMRSVGLLGFALRTCGSPPLNWCFTLSVPAAWETDLGILLSPPASPGRDGLPCGAQVSIRASGCGQRKGESASHSSFLSGEDVVNPWAVEEASCCPSDKQPRGRADLPEQPVVCCGSRTIAVMGLFWQGNCREEPSSKGSAVCHLHTAPAGRSTAWVFPSHPGDMWEQHVPDTPELGV